MYYTCKVLSVNRGVLYLRCCQRSGYPLVDLIVPPPPFPSLNSFSTDGVQPGGPGSDKSPEAQIHGRMAASRQDVQLMLILFSKFYLFYFLFHQSDPRPELFKQCKPKSNPINYIMYEMYLMTCGFCLLLSIKFKLHYPGSHQLRSDSLLSFFGNYPNSRLDNI